MSAAVLTVQQVFQGTIGDIRIFDDIRTQAEINDNHFTTLTGNEQGLAHNWQVQAGDTTTVTDVAADPAANQTINLTTYLRSSFDRLAKFHLDNRTAPPMPPVRCLTIIREPSVTQDS